MNKLIQPRWRAMTLLTILVLLWTTVTPAVTRAQASMPLVEEPNITTVPETEPTVTAAAAAADCSNSPFGGLLLVGAEREIFVSYRGGTAPHQGELIATRLDLTNAGKFQPQATWFGSTTDAALGNVTDPAATVADLNADGKFEFVQAFRDANGEYRLAAQSNSAGSDTWQGTATNHQSFATAAGNLTRSAGGDQEIAVVSRSPVDSLNVHLINGASDGGLPGDLQTLGLWRSVENFRQAPELLDVATGDLDGDGYNDEVIVAFREATMDWIQLVVLEYTPNHQQGSGSNYESNLMALASLRVEAGKVLNLGVAAADIDGDYQAEIVLAYDHGNEDNDGFSNKITVRTY
ncbi:MAG: hypothetical protein KDE31_14905, partial [Caldilineaceae bacterium]|nr:hypothetical protein [Caldilineaceae bacterium]